MGIVDPDALPNSERPSPAPPSTVTAIAKTVRWYIDEQPWWRTILNRGYNADRLGLIKPAQQPLAQEAAK